ncbi:MAG TPA: SDR family oxidoreductase [Acidimicrobiales bacterium]|jgi:3-oxoacyl-[acyl-carrier protein] reductase|nr:SDR family oxidoreductase [Acidimicrobiales bacterium]
MIDPFQDYDLSGRVAALTGGASGIGACSAELLAGAGAAVVVGDIDLAGAEAVASRIRDGGGQAVAQRVDVSKKTEVDDFVDRAVAEFGRLDVMGNIAGIMNFDLVVDVTEAVLDRLIAVNQKGVFFGCQAALRVMMPQRSGSIINFASAAIDVPNPNVSVYSMTKAAVAMLTMELAIEAGPYGIRVNCLAPGTTPTNFGREARLNDKGEIDPTKFAAYVDRSTNMSPIGRMGEALDQAHLVHYLASDASKFATGAIFRANGGVGIVW